MNSNKGQTLFLSMIGIATLLVAIVGATFAWFSATVTGNDTASSVIVNTATLGITYNNGTELRLDNAVPGDPSNPVTFTVAANEGTTVDQKYKIYFDVLTNDFVDKTDLEYSLTGSGNTNGGTLVSSTTINAQVPSTGNNNQVGTIATLKPNETHSYEMIVTFKSTADNQNDNQGKKFQGKIRVASENVNAA